MDVETGSTNTSLDDKTEDFCENPTRDTLAEGLLCLLKPTIDQLDERVKITRITQLELKQQIDGLAEELKKIAEDQGCSVDLEAYTNKLINARQKITVVSNILQAAQDRLQKVEAQISREAAGRRSLLEPSPNIAPVEVQQQPSPVQEMKLKTPEWSLNDIKDDVYEPSEDTFLFIDALENDLDWIMKQKPKVVLEVGSGSGIVITALSNALKGSAYFIATDINPIACEATRSTAALNNTQVEVIRSNLISGIQPGTVDLLLFNPPYVVTDSDEVEKDTGISRSYAGGIKGRQVMDRLFPLLPSLMTPHSCCYVVVINENKPDEISLLLSNLGFEGSIVAQRRAGIERLSVMKFVRV